jgi:hypothetical protein
MTFDHDAFHKNMDAYTQTTGYARQLRVAREHTRQYGNQYHRMAAEAALECLEHDLLLSHPENRLSEIPYVTRIYHEMLVMVFRVSRELSLNAKDPERYIEDLKVVLDDIDNPETPLDRKRELAYEFSNYYTTGVGYFEGYPAFDAFMVFVENKLRG